MNQVLMDRAYATMQKQYRILKEQQTYISKAMAMNAELSLNLYPHTTIAKNEPLLDKEFPWTP